MTQAAAVTTTDDTAVRFASRMQLTSTVTGMFLFSSTVTGRQSRESENS